MARSLYKRIYMHFLGLLVAVAAMSSWIFLGSWPGTYLTEGNLRLASHLARLLVAAPDPATRRALALSLGQELDLDVTLYDGSGAIVARRGRRPLPLLHVTEPTVHRELGLWFVAAPVAATDEPPLTLECVQGTFTDWAVPVRKTLSLVGLLMMIAFVVRPLARRISRPIERLIEASRRFGDGDLSTRVAMPRFGHSHSSRWQKRRRGGDELFTLLHAWNDMAERIQRQVSSQRELLANVSHELRSPLARIRVALALLPLPSYDGGKVGKRITDIEADLGELDTLIEEVLQTSRLEATGMPSHEDRFSVSVLYDEVLARAAADPLTAPLEVAVDPRRFPGGVYLRGDCALLRRAVFNLVENAAKYGAAPVVLGFEARPDAVALTVTDGGPGISADERERVVRPFARGDLARTPGRSGVGLGLSFASRGAEVHGGRLGLEDPPRRGLRVVLYLPADRAEGALSGAHGEQGA